MSKQTEGRPIDILLVEDNPGDACLAREAMVESKIKNELHHVTDGEQALAYLRKQGAYAQAPRPDLILLDLNLPLKDGREVLAELKNDVQFKRIPIVVLTVSSDDIDILKAYNLHANCFISKPLDLEQFMTIVRTIESFWLTIVSLPNGVSD